MAEDLDLLVRKYVLQNAVKYGGKPQAGTVVSRILGEYPELRPEGRKLSVLAKAMVAEVSALPPGKQREELAALAPRLLEELSETREHARAGLPALERAEKGVVMRFAPNPSGPLHLGHARAALLNDAYVRRYGGKYILRIEDTDPRRIDPDAYTTVREDCDWLGLLIGEIVYQSDRLETYYEHARKLIEIGGAYVCTCEADQFRELKLAKSPCPCREGDPEKNLGLFEAMLGGEYAEGEVTVRVKTDIEHPDPAVRDFSALRIVSSPPHPRVEATVFPLMNFSVAVDDHLLGITHVIRGKDHIANTARQRYIFDYFGWKQPVYKHYGRMGIEGVVLSTSQMKAGIAEGTYTGWDDLRLGTLRAIARRGITAAAVRNAVLEIGIGETDISFSWENLYAKNRDIVDPVANRYSFVPDPVFLEVADAPCGFTVEALLHPGDPARGVRRLSFDGTVLLPKEDVDAACGRMVRLKDLFNIRLGEGKDCLTASFAGKYLEEARRAKAPIIQWLPPAHTIPCVLHKPDGDLKGYCEPMVSLDLGKVVQFERVGFARIEKATAMLIEACWAHR
ncbi:MAG TPA: glutamate--tRNA ligase [Methanomicrobiales archaeon]|jgi:glutamyl-tRNA synthetase|nr:glutamate--tRNA ligase [Methanomicrobiales archaeon]